MSNPQGPDQPWEGDPTAPPREQYADPSYRPGAYEPPRLQQPYPPQNYPPQNYPPQNYPPQQYEPVGHRQQPSYPQQQYGGQQYGGQQYGDQQYGGQQHGDQQYPPQPYGGHWQTAPPKRPGNRTPLIVAAVAVVVVALVILGIVVFTGGDDTKNSAQTPPPTTSAPVSSSAPAPSSPTSSAPTTSSTLPAGATPTAVSQITVPSVISGWQGVLSYKENVAYDIPPDWKIETPGTLVGFEDNNGRPIAIMHGVSTYKDEACPNVSGSYRGHTGFKTAGNLDPTVAARGGLRIFAEGIALNDDGSSAPISGTTLKDIKVDGGKISAKYARATVTLDDKSDCGSPSAIVVAVAFRSASNATALFIGYFDQGVSDALPLATVEKIFTTLRPYQR